MRRKQPDTARKNQPLLNSIIDSVSHCIVLQEAPDLCDGLFWKATVVAENRLVSARVAIIMRDGEDEFPILADLPSDRDGSYSRIFRLPSAPSRVAFQVQPASAVDQGLTYRFEHVRFKEQTQLLLSKIKGAAGRPSQWLGKWRHFTAASMPLSFRRSDQENETPEAQCVRLQAMYDHPDEQARIRLLLASARNPLPSLKLVLLERTGGPEPSIRILSARIESATFVLNQVSQIDHVVLVSGDDNLPARQIVERLLAEEPDAVIFASDSGTLTELGPALLLAALQSPGVAMATGDYLTPAADSLLRWVALPSFSRVLLQESNYISGAGALVWDQKVATLFAGLKTEALTLSGLARALSQDSLDSAFNHVPRAVFICRNASLPALGNVLQPGRELTNQMAADSKHRISIIIPTKDRADTLPPLVNRLLPLLDRHMELIIVDNGSRQPDVLGFLKQAGGHVHVQVVRIDTPFNFANLCNRGRAQATGDVIVFLNDDIAFNDPTVFSKLAASARRPELGCVGAWLIYPTGKIQHAGMIIGTNGVCQHEYAGLSPDAPDVDDPRFHATHDVAAVTGACLAVRAEIFDAAGGFDPAYAVTLNDIDLCLRVRRLGLINIVMRDVVLTHHESLSRGLDSKTSQMVRLNLEVSLFCRTWCETLLVGDPYRSPLFRDESSSLR
jgi:GT2 family glycosyltransferase